MKRAKLRVNELTVAYWKARGYTIARVEKFNQHTKRMHDLFGFADFLAFHPDKAGVILIQSTSADNLAARISKTLAEPRAAAWVRSGVRVIYAMGFIRAKPGGTTGLKLVRIAQDDFSRTQTAGAASEAVPADPGPQIATSGLSGEPEPVPVAKRRPRRAPVDISGGVEDFP